MRLTPLLLAAAVAAAAPAGAQEPPPEQALQPEIQRPAATAQAVGAVHTLRQIPEACARIEGAFTGQAAEPYRFAVVRTSANCQPRARFVDAEKAQPSVAAGWKFNDLIRVPSAACPSQQAVVRVWRKPLDQAVERDAQGRARLYLQDVSAAAKRPGAGAPQLPMYAATMAVEGEPCGG